MEARINHICKSEDPLNREEFSSPILTTCSSYSVQAGLVFQDLLQVVTPQTS